jgi:hypothetical protein
MTFLWHVAIGFSLGTLIIVWAILWWLGVRAVRHWWWRLEDRAIKRIRERRP